MVDAVVPLRIRSAPHARAAWTEGLRVQWPVSLIERAGWRSCVDSNGDLRVPDRPLDVTAGDVQRLRERRAFTDRPPASARLPVSYHVVPGWARALVASAIGRWNRRRVQHWAAFPDWPLDLSADALDDLRTDGDATFRRTPVVITHDIDSTEGLTNLVDRFLLLEESLGARSTNYIVPCAGPIDEGRLREVIARGHDIGVHGYDHSNRTPFATADERSRRLDAGRAFADRFGATGYRAPSLLRTRALLRDVGARFRYDSSIPTSGGLFPVPNNGCASARPFLIEDTTELPVSLPRDGMLRFLGYSPDQILGMWIECADRIARARGVVVLLTHCERRFSGTAAMLDAYRRFLEHVGAHADRFVFRRPDDALAEIV